MTRPNRRQWVAMSVSTLSATAIALALAYSLPISSGPERAAVSMVMGVVLGVPLALVGLGIADRPRKPRRRKPPAMVLDRNGPISWLSSTTGRGGTEVGIEPPCDGSPLCGGAIHLREPSTSLGGRWLELHLTKAELRSVRTLIDEALKVP